MFLKTINLKRAVVLIFLLGFILRLYRFDFPIADWHSWRQTDTSAVSRIFAERGFDVLHPKYLDISNIQTGKNNPEGLRYVEFPLYNIFQAGFYKTFGFLTIEEWGRLVSIISSLLTALFLYLLLRKYYFEKAAFFATLFYLLSPFSIYYGRTVLPDTSMIMTSIGAIYFFDKYIDSDKKKKGILYLGLATIFASSSLLLKPYAAFFLIPIVFIAFKKYGLRSFLKIELWIFSIISILPFVLWRIWVVNFPEGVPANLWLLNGNGIRFRPAFFKWIIYERLTKLILGYLGIFIVLSGLFNLKKIRNNFLGLSFILSSILYVIIFATGNVQHDYYQILILPSVAIVFGLGAEYLLRQNDLIKIFSVLVMLFSFILSANQVKDYFNINNEAAIIAGIKSDKILPKNAKVIAPYNGDTTLLYYINRPGWPAFQSSIEDLIRMGATHLVIVSPSENDLNGFGRKYKILSQDKDYLILNLK